MVRVVSALRLHEEEVWAMATGLEAPDMRDAADCKVEGRSQSQKLRSFYSWPSDLNQKPRVLASVVITCLYN